ncbi:hypothetical protein C8J57DRAFT_1367153 [Mycena rebaudengoi]|nr:hypothetical protein C8J57DRAFT_1367153 [Mycena rebaudengoi]
MLFSLLSLAFALSTTLSCSASKAIPDNWYQRNKNTIQGIYNLTVFPANTRIIAGGAAAVPPGLFNVNATGRITPVGQFANDPSAITKATIVAFTSGCPEVASSVVYLTVSTVNPDNSTGPYVSSQKQIAFWRFDDEGAVLKYDAWLPGLDHYVRVINRGEDPYDAASANATVHAVCDAQALTCTGKNMQYANAAECVSILEKKKLGNFDDAWGDNVQCRTIHQKLTELRPEVHCVHVGPTGGGKCIDVEYNDVYFNDPVLFGEPAGQTFICPEPGC